MRTRRVSTAVIASAVLALGTACAAVLLSLPRPAEPGALPCLALEPSAIAAVREADAELAAQVPDNEATRALQKLLSDKGRAEKKLTEPLYEHRRRQQAIRDNLQRLRDAAGERAVWALRARAVGRFEMALDLTLQQEQLPGVIGGFPILLERYGLTQDGEILGPMFVVRTMYKARWNRIHELAADAGLHPVERRAYHGWIGLHAERVPIPERLTALRRYAEWEPALAAEGAASLHSRAGQTAAARRALRAAQQARRRSLRLRNKLVSVPQSH